MRLISNVDRLLALKGFYLLTLAILGVFLFAVCLDRGPALARRKSNPGMFRVQVANSSSAATLNSSLIFHDHNENNNASYMAHPLMLTQPGGAKSRLMATSSARLGGTSMPGASLGIAMLNTADTTRFANGYVKTDGYYYDGRATVTLSLSGQTLQTVVAEPGGYFQFFAAPIGAVLTAIVDGYSFESLTVDDASPNFIINGVSVTTPIPTPTPTPVSTPTPTPTPTPTSTVATTRYANGYVKTDGYYYDGRATVTLSLSGQLLQTVIAEPGGYFQFFAAPIGAVLTAIVDGYSFESLTVDDGSPYFIIDGVSGPTPTPMPTPTPTPTPTPIAPPSPSPTPTPNSMTTYYVSPSGSGTACTIAFPCTLATAVGGSSPVQAGDTVELGSGIYHYDSVTFGHAGTSPTVMTIYKAGLGARPIITSTTNTPPNIFMGDYMRLDGLWIGGTKQTSDQTGIFTGGNPISHWKQIVNCTIWGYYGAIKSGSQEYGLYQGNRFVKNGGGNLYHAIYISSNEPFPGPPGTATHHVIVDNNIFIAGVGDGGYAVHFFHNNRTGIASRNFITGAHGLVMDGQEELATNNFLWKSGVNGTSDVEALDWLYITVHGYALNNILGPIDALMNPNTAGNTNLISNNALESATNNGYNKGLNAITITAGNEGAEIGLPATSIDNAISALKASFSASNSAILADSTIETNFAMIKGITVPSGSPLFLTGRPWFDANAINVGPNSGEPTTVEGFWQAFKALGLREYDANGQIIPY